MIHKCVGVSAGRHVSVCVCICVHLCKCLYEFIESGKNEISLALNKVPS